MYRQFRQSYFVIATPLWIFKSLYHDLIGRYLIGCFTLWITLSANRPSPTKESRELFNRPDNCWSSQESVGNPRHWFETGGRLLRSLIYLQWDMVLWAPHKSGFTNIDSLNRIRVWVSDCQWLMTNLSINNTFRSNNKMKEIGQIERPFGRPLDFHKVFKYTLRF